MKPTFSADFFISNRRRLLRELDTDLPVVIAGHGQVQRTSDSVFPFQQDSNFWYLAGIDEPDLVLVLHHETEFIIAPIRDATRSAFDGALDLTDMSQRSGIQEILSLEAGWSRLAALLSKHKQAYTLGSSPLYNDRHGMYLNPARQRLQRQMKQKSSGLILHDCRTQLATMRMIKQAAEITCMERAAAISRDTIRLVAQAHAESPYEFEYQVEAAITAGFRSHGTKGHAYTPIVASGKHATTLHYIRNDAPINRGDIIVIDAGAEIEHFAADITRSIHDGRLTNRQQSVYDAVVDIKQRAEVRIKPGALFRELEDAVVKDTGKALKDLGLITSTTDIAGIRHYFPHSSSHFLGLDVHDVGDYAKPLVENVVLTCEPGIYIPEEAIGVRIEDDLVVTRDGSRTLGDKTDTISTSV